MPLSRVNNDSEIKCKICGVPAQFVWELPTEKDLFLCSECKQLMEQIESRCSGDDIDERRTDIRQGPTKTI